MRHFRTAPLFIVAALAACNSNNNNGGVPPPPGPTPTPPPAVLKLYVNNQVTNTSVPRFGHRTLGRRYAWLPARPGAHRLFGTTGQIQQYIAPFTSASSPSLTLSSANGFMIPAQVAFDSAGAAYVPDQSTGKVYVYNQPLATTSQPAFSFALPTGVLAFATAFDSSGKLYIGDAFGGTNTVYQYTPPFSATSTPSLLITNGINSPDGMAFDSTGNMWVANCSFAPSTLTEYAPPYSGAPTTTITNGIQCPDSVAIDSKGSLYTGEDAIGASGVVVYNPPFTNSSTPAYVIPVIAPPDSTGGVNFDAAGNLYVVRYHVAAMTGDVAIYNPPFSAASVPAQIITNGIARFAGIPSFGP